jgi:DNA-3-methyladenine glycosylase II
MPRPSAGSRTNPLKSSRTAVAALRAADPVMARLVGEHGAVVRRDLKRERPGDAYGALLRSIVGQQLSTRAARTIFERLKALFGGRTPAPRELLDTDPEELRRVGLSRSKVAFLRDLAEHVEDRELRLDRLAELPDEEVLEQLTAIKGLGPWTVQMFLIFHLGRPDVLPVGDLGIRRAVQVEYGLEELPSPGELERIAEAWRPHRSLACLYLWRSLDKRTVLP